MQFFRMLWNALALACAGLTSQASSRMASAMRASKMSGRFSTMCRIPAFSHGLFARQVPSETMVQMAVQKLLSFWTAPPDV